MTHDLLRALRCLGWTVAAVAALVVQHAILPGREPGVGDVGVVLALVALYRTHPS